MKYLLLSIGTRGDMEPFLALGELLAARGHEVVCVMPDQFAALVADTPLGFRPLDRGFLELIEGETGRAFMGQKGNFIHRLKMVWWSMVISNTFYQESSLSIKTMML